MGDYPKRMYHPRLTPPDNETTAMAEGQAAVYAEAGWLDAPEAVDRPGYAPEPVQYVQGDDGLWAPQEPEPEPEPAKAKRVSKTSKSSEDSDT